MYIQKVVRDTARARRRCNFVPHMAGLPWMCSATVQSLNHIRAMSTYPSPGRGGNGKLDTPTNVIETRLTGFSVHAAILASSLIVPLLAKVPLCVVSGVFLYLGRKVREGVDGARRCETVQ